MAAIHKLTEDLGLLLGPIPGVIFGTIGALRRSRTFHPKGILYVGRVKFLDARLDSHPHALIRYSWSLRKDGGKDVLGIGLRLSRYPITSVLPSSDDQDLLFATFKKFWRLPGAFLTTKKNFFANEYFTALPFHWENEDGVTFKLESSIEGLTLWCKRKKAEWKKIASIELTAKSPLDQEALFFDPFQNGLRIRPQGFFQHLRKGTYAMARRMRPRETRPQRDFRRDRFPDEGSASPSSPL